LTDSPSISNGQLLAQKRRSHNKRATQDFNVTPMGRSKRSPAIALLPRMMSRFETEGFETQRKSRLLPIGQQAERYVLRRCRCEAASRAKKDGPIGLCAIAGVSNPPVLIEPATVIARSLPVECERAGKCAGIAEADLKCNRRDRRRLFAIDAWSPFESAGFA